MDMTNAQAYLNKLRETSGAKVTVTHLVIKALAEVRALAATLVLPTWCIFPSKPWTEILLEKDWLLPAWGAAT